jgi:hypothetical protein
MLAFHPGRGDLDEEAVSFPHSFQSSPHYLEVGLISICRYPEALADKSFDNTGCESDAFSSIEVAYEKY